ncbi:MAG: ATP-binding cassette domain-containing protein [Pseudomonadota bacterium]
MNGTPYALEAREVSKHVTSPEGELTILRNITLAIRAGDSVAIVGASGSGKSTLLGLLAGLDLPSEGEIFLDGHALSTLDEDARAGLRAERVGFVFQSFQLFPTLNALENVLLPLELSSADDAESQAHHLLERVGLGARIRHYPNQLSGGEQQRVAIARAFASRPAILFADEPTGNLDRGSANKVRDLLFELNAERATTLVLVTHDIRLAELCERQLELEAGAMRDERERTPAHA